MTVFQRRGFVPQACLNGTSRFATSSPSGPGVGAWRYGGNPWRHDVRAWPRQPRPTQRDHLQREYGIHLFVKGGMAATIRGEGGCRPNGRGRQRALGRHSRTRARPLPASTIKGMTAPNRRERRRGSGEGTPSSRSDSRWTMTGRMVSGRAAGKARTGRSSPTAPGLPPRTVRITSASVAPADIAGKGVPGGWIRQEKRPPPALLPRTSRPRAGQPRPGEPPLLRRLLWSRR